MTSKRKEAAETDKHNANQMRKLKKERLKPLTEEQKQSLAQDVDREMFGDDADYLRHAGIDDIGDK